MKRICAFMSAMLLAGSLAAAQPNPIVKMRVTLPDGETKELSAAESDLATFSLKDRTDIGVRPTILDSKPGTRVVVTFFKTPSTTHPTEEIGAIETKPGGSTVQTTTNPSFKVAVVSVSEPAGAGLSTARR
jgi:hypothetical protein